MTIFTELVEPLIGNHLSTEELERTYCLLTEEKDVSEKMLYKLLLSIHPQK